MRLDEVKRIGPKTVELLNKLGINDTTDLTTYYPFRYDIIKQTTLDEELVIVDGIIETVPSYYRIKKQLDKISFKFRTNDIIANVIIFNRGFMRTYLKVGSNITVIGKYDKLHNTITANDIRLVPIGSSTIIEPIYHLTYGLSRKQLAKYIEFSLTTDFEVIDYIPTYLMEKYSFINKRNAILEVHKPHNAELLKKSLDLLKYEEFFIFMLKMDFLKNNQAIKKGLKREVDKNLINEFINNLPFKLTIDQLKAVDDIYDDLISPKRMNRLLQGDVGSGKTLVAVISIYINYLSNYQSALMVPTEILAIQHYETVKNLFKDLNINVALVTSKLKAKEKREIYEKLENGSIDIAIGTHALITEKIKYKNLGLVITDEQHRFGVNQRSELKNKGITPDTLYMSATPIPRTYALTLYGDMDISSIKTMPNGRKDIITTLKKESEIKDVLTLMLNELKNNHQIYVIAPLVEESEKVNLENVNNLYNKMNVAFGKYYKVGLLHGKMTSQEKDEVMNKYKNNEIKILVATTVIEVGIDVKNATTIVIFDAFRFGLSALHQLRGRVGRSELQSYCVLISNYEKERLKIMTETCDGFKISEEDFKLRGSGDLFGIKQSGDMSFDLADVKKDFSLLIQVKQDVEEFTKCHQDVNKKLIEKITKDVMNLD